MEHTDDDPTNDKNTNGGAMVTFAWRPSNCLTDGEVISTVQLAGSFTEWKPVKMTPPPKPRTMSSSSVSSDCPKSPSAEDLESKCNLNQLGYWTLQQFLSPGTYEYKYVVYTTNEHDGGTEKSVWLHDDTKESQPDGMGGRNNVLKVEDFHKGKGDSMSLSRTVSHDEAESEGSDISEDDSDDNEDISIIQKDEGSGDGWVILSRKRSPVSQEETNERERQASSDSSDSTEKRSKRSSYSSIEIIDGPESPLVSSETQSQEGEISKREPHPRVSTTTPVRSPGCDIERKFFAPSDYQKRLEELGFVPAKHFKDEILDDCYYDFIPYNNSSDTGSLSHEYPLLSNDHWLRQRNGDWELKYPVNAEHSLPTNTCSNAVRHLVTHYESQKFGKMVLYHQTSCPEDILSKLKIITPDAIKDDQTLNKLLSSGILRTFSKLRTSRNCFKYGETSEKKPSPGCDVNIIVEMTSWGCLIGEIEVIVESKNELLLASSEIDRLANVLGFEQLDLTKMASRGISN